MQKNLIQSEWVIKWQIKFIVAKWKAVAVRGNYPLNLHAKWWALKYDSSRMSSQKKQKKRKPEQIKCLEVIKKKKREKQPLQGRKHSHASKDVLWCRYIIDAVFCSDSLVLKRSRRMSSDMKYLPYKEQWSRQAHLVWKRDDERKGEGDKKYKMA